MDCRKEFFALQNLLFNFKMYENGVWVNQDVGKQTCHATSKIRSQMFLIWRFMNANDLTKIIVWAVCVDFA